MYILGCIKFMSGSYPNQKARKYHPHQINLQSLEIKIWVKEGNSFFK